MSRGNRGGKQSRKNIKQFVHFKKVSAPPADLGNGLRVASTIYSPAEKVMYIAAYYCNNAPGKVFLSSSFKAVS